MITLAELSRRAFEDREHCRTYHERLMADTINRREMRECVERIVVQRSLTATERNISEQWGLI